MQRLCLRCDGLFTTSQTRRLFDCDECWHAWVDENLDGHCYYCGEAATEEDHLFPQSIGHGVGERLPACSECNGLLSNRHPDSHLKRLHWLLEELREMYADAIEATTWHTEEVESLGGLVAAHIQQDMYRQRRAVRRLHHLYDRLLETVDHQWPAASEVGTDYADYGVEREEPKADPSSDSEC